MSTRGRPREDEDLRAGHRRAVGQEDGLDLPDVPQSLVRVTAPEGMWPLAAEAWDEYVEELITLKILHKTDLARLRELCVQTAIGVECEASLEEFGAMMKEPITVWSKELQAEEMVGWKVKRNPAGKEAREAATASRLIAAELGLTPLSRIRGNLMVAQTNSYVFGLVESLDEKLDAEDAAFKVGQKKPANKKRGGK